MIILFFDNLFMNLSHVGIYKFSLWDENFVLNRWLGKLCTSSVIHLNLLMISIIDKLFQSFIITRKQMHLVVLSLFYNHYFWFRTLTSQLICHRVWNCFISVTVQNQSWDLYVADSINCWPVHTWSQIVRHPALCFPVYNIFCRCKTCF